MPVLDFADDVAGPPRRVAAIVPSDSTDFATPTRYVWVKTAGTIVLVGADDASDAGTDLGSVSAETIIWGRFRRVKATGTTAQLVGFF